MQRHLNLDHFAERNNNPEKLNLDSWLLILVSKSSLLLSTQ